MPRVEISTLFYGSKSWVRMPSGFMAYFYIPERVPPASDIRFHAKG